MTHAKGLLGALFHCVLNTKYGSQWCEFYAEIQPRIGLERRVFYKEKQNGTSFK
jgi:hypothetical protein